MVDLLDRYRVFVGQVNPDLKRKQEERKNNIVANPASSYLGDLNRRSGEVLQTIATGNDGFQPSDILMAIPRTVGVVSKGYRDVANTAIQTNKDVANVGNEATKAVVEGINTGLNNRSPIENKSPSVTQSPRLTPVTPIVPSSLGPEITQTTSPVASEAQVADARNSLLTAQGPLERRVYTTVEGTAFGVVPQGKQRGGFVGAPTDAIAARNLQDRLEQDNAAHAIAQSTDRAIEASRDTRAERLGIPRNTLDAIEGRSNSSPSLPTVPTQTSPFSQPGDSYGDEVLRRDQLIRDINNPRASKTDRQAAINTYNSYLDDAKNNTAVQIASLRENKAQAINPVDVQKFLLDRERFGWQQGIDQKRLALQAEDAGSKAEINRLNQQKYNDEARTKFLNDFSYPDKNVSPQQSSELEALAWQLSQSTNAAIPPEVMIGYLQKAAQNNNVDWEDAPPKSLVALGEAAMRLARNDYK